ncbi:hypothetical protein FB451DRAFT_1187478 [Mycena latifolia]|nr:hypothetical protein FB451DRAFT_1187478 [Mycena latifolia]
MYSIAYGWGFRRDANWIYILWLFLCWYEAQQAHYYSLNPGIALTSVTSTPAYAMGVGWRIATLAADLVVWDSHPLALGATPVQVYIDGIPQLSSPTTLHRPAPFQDVPATPSWKKEVQETIEFEGLPPLTVLRALRRHGWRCAARGFASDARVIDLMGGALAPGLTTFGSDLGLSEFKLEPSTTNGRVFDPLTMAVPGSLGDTVVRAVDGLQFADTRTAGALLGLSSHRWALASCISTAFSTGAPNALADGAILQSETALHISIHSEMRASVSTQIAALRNMLFSSSATGPWSRVKAGEIPLVIKVHNADVMPVATLLLLKGEFEASTSATLRMTFAGATEAHVLAAQIGTAGVSVILAPARSQPNPGTNAACTCGPHSRFLCILIPSEHSLPGPPLSKKTPVMALLQHGVNLALGVQSEYGAQRALRARLDADGAIDYATAMVLSTTNMDKALGLDSAVAEREDLVIYQGGGLFDLESKVLGVVSGRRAVVDLF